MHRGALFALTLLSAPAWAGGDYAAEASKIMRTSIDLDVLEQQLNAPAATGAGAFAHDDAFAYAPVAALPLEPNSDVDQVVVFGDRALVTRVIASEVPAGATSVTFEGLPLGLATDSLYAQARAGNARIVGVELLSGTGEVEDTEHIVALRAEMRVIADRLGEVRDRIVSLLTQRDYLRGALLTPGGADRPPQTVDQVRSGLVFLGDTERDIAAKLRKEQETATELDKELSPLLIKLANPNATGLTVRVDLDAPTAGRVEVGLRYQVFGARWWPSYNARLDEGSDQVTLEYYGVVAQQTGEDWKDVALMLSTADASVTGGLPALESWYLGRDTSGTYYVEDNLAVGRGYYDTPTNQMAQQAAAPEGVVSSHMSASVQGAGAVVFAIPGRRTVAGDGSEQRLPVGTQTFASVIELATVPKLVPEIYRRARLRYDGQCPLLPGALASVVGSDYVGAESTGTVVPGEELRLSFGTDDRLKVERQLVSREQEFLGAGKKTTRYTFYFRIRVKNFGDGPQEVLITDQLPVSEIERVTVEMLATTPPLAAAADDPPGILRWRVVVSPGGEQTIDLRFQVTAPREVEEQGQLHELMF
jgi:uncharacterized protein (TIGR02231 family)